MSALLPESLPTAVTRQLGIRYPLVAAPMFLVSTPALLESAARAGGIGAVPSLNFRTHAEYADFLARFPAGLAFGVNLILKWAERLEEDVRATVARRVPLVITSLGDPTRVIEAVHGYGGKVWCDVVGARHAEKAVRAGADALVAVGAGAGGHAGGVSPLVLVPWLARRFDVPVLLAGGVATGGQLAAALALGAGGAYVGTRFLASTESGASEGYKAAVVEAGPEDVELTPEVTGVPGNFLRASLERLRAGEAGKAWKDTWSAGQAVALVDDVQPVAVLMERLVREYVEARGSLP